MGYLLTYFDHAYLFQVCLSTDVIKTDAKT